MGTLVHKSIGSRTTSLDPQGCIFWGQIILESPLDKIIVVSTHLDPHDECFHPNPYQRASGTFILAAVSRVPRIHKDYTVQP